MDRWRSSLTWSRAWTLPWYLISEVPKPNSPNTLHFGIRAIIGGSWTSREERPSISSLVLLSFCTLNPGSLMTAPGKRNFLLGSEMRGVRTDAFVEMGLEASFSNFRRKRMLSHCGEETGVERALSHLQCCRGLMKPQSTCRCFLKGETGSESIHISSPP